MLINSSGDEDTLAVNGTGTVKRKTALFICLAGRYITETDAPLGVNKTYWQYKIQKKLGRKGGVAGVCQAES